MNWYYGFDLLFIISLVITIGSQIYINVSYGKYKKIKNRNGITGFEIARKILDKNGLSDVHVVSVKGELTDHYDPSRKVVRLSNSIFNGTSIASMSVAAHEVGHAIQDKEGYTMMKIRSKIVPIVNFASKIGYFVLIIGFLFGELGWTYAGIGLLSTTLIFQLVTLPVEFDASRRAREELVNMNIVCDNEEEGCVNMLKAAAFTYVAALVNTLIQILRLILAARND